MPMPMPMKKLARRDRSTTSTSEEKGHEREGGSRSRKIALRCVALRWAPFVREHLTVGCNGELLMSVRWVAPLLQPGRGIIMLNVTC